MRGSIHASIGAAVLAAFISACRADQHPIQPSSDVESLQVQGVGQPNLKPFVADQTPRDQMPFEDIVRALGNDEETDGTLLVGLKEPLAVRGVGTGGRALPLQARFLARDVILTSFPELTLVDDIERRIRPQSTSGAITTRTIHRTFLRVEAPRDIAFLTRLADHANVDYLAPNYVNGVLLGGEPMIAAATVSSEYRPWGVDSVRAPTIWARGIRGDNVVIGMADTGMDVQGWGTPSYSLHPDIWFQWAFTNFVDDAPDNQCPSIFSEDCFWEEPYHGTGVLGAAAGRENGIGSMGVAPTEDAYQYISKVFYLAPGPFPNRLPEDKFHDGVLWASDPFHGTRVAVTSVGYNTTQEQNFPTLHDAFIIALNSYGVLWFAAAGNNGSFVVLPGRFDEVVAVGGLNQSLQKAGFSPVDSELELVAPSVELILPWHRNDPDGTGPYTRTVSGTSFAAPMAMAVARLYLETNPGISATALRAEMHAHARDLGTPGFDNDYGYGMPDAVCLIDQLSPCTVP